jgi:hypothetical protein
MADEDFGTLVKREMIAGALGGFTQDVIMHPVVRRYTDTCARRA